MTMVISDEQQRQFRDRGYFILERAIAPDDLEMLRSELDYGIAAIEVDMDAAGSDVLGLSHRGQRYFVHGRYQRYLNDRAAGGTVEQPADAEPLRQFLYSDLMAEICRATIGGGAWFFLEQFVVKMQEVGMRFGWHQDAGYLKWNNIVGWDRPYVTCWCALDDVTEENGTIYVLPYDRAGSREVADHEFDEATNDRVGYHGDDPGDPVVVPAGSIAVFASNVFHRSGPNSTGERRRSYVVQFASQPIERPTGFPECVPFLINGRRVEA